MGLAGVCVRIIQLHIERIALPLPKLVVGKTKGVYFVMRASAGLYLTILGVEVACAGLLCVAMSLTPRKPLYYGDALQRSLNFYILFNGIYCVLLSDCCALWC